MSGIILKQIIGFKSEHRFPINIAHLIISWTVTESSETYGMPLAELKNAWEPSWEMPNGFLTLMTRNKQLIHMMTNKLRQSMMQSLTSIFIREYILESIRLCNHRKDIKRLLRRGVQLQFHPPQSNPSPLTSDTAFGISQSPLLSPIHLNDPSLAASPAI